MEEYKDLSAESIGKFVFAKLPQRPTYDTETNCKRCGELTMSTMRRWCRACEARDFVNGFFAWNSGDVAIDRIIQYTQLNAGDIDEFIEWIPFKRLSDFARMGEGKYSTLVAATWLDGPRQFWNADIEEYERIGPTKVALRVMDNRRKMYQDLLHQMKSQLRYTLHEEFQSCYGITQDPESKRYMIVVEYSLGCDLHSYIDRMRRRPDYRWIKKIQSLRSVADSLKLIHDDRLVHGTLHGGNILICDPLPGLPHKVRLSDSGLCWPMKEPIQAKYLFGVLPYAAPEIIRGRNITPAADAYTVGILMWVFATERRPFADRPHDLKLAREILQGLRPEIPEDTPDFYVQIMVQCWHDEPLARPTCDDLIKIFSGWFDEIHSAQNTSAVTQFGYDDEKRAQRIQELLKQALGGATGCVELTQEIHPEAVYTSRSFNFTS